MRISTLSAALVTLALAPAARAGDRYHFTTIDAPEAVGFTSTLDVNDRGDIAGAYTDAAGTYHGYLLIDGAFQRFDVPGSTMTACTCIEADGRVTGVYGDAEGHQHGFQWAHGELVTIDYPGAAYNTDLDYVFGTGFGTYAVRSAGRRLVGDYADAAGGVHGFLEDHGVFHAIDYPGSLTSFGNGTNVIGFNDLGVATGGYFLDTATPYHGFLYDRGEYTTFDFPGAAGFLGTQVNALNNVGGIVGLYSDANDQIHGFVYRGGRFATVDVPGEPYTEIDAINDFDVITGYWAGSDGVSHGFVGTPW